VVNIVNLGTICVKVVPVNDAINEIKDKVKTRKSDIISLREIVKVFWDIGDKQPIVKANPVRFRFDRNDGPQFLLIEEGKISFHFRLVMKEWIFDRYVLK